MGSRTAFVRLEMTRKITFPDKCFVAAFYVAHMTADVYGFGSGGRWFFAVGPVLEDHVGFVIWFHEAFVDE